MSDFISSQTSISPSELAFLNGAHFASRGLFYNAVLLDGKTKVSQSQIVEKILLVAILANEAAGVFKLAIADDKFLFITLKKLKIAKIKTSHPWPKNSIDGYIASSSMTDVGALIYHFLGEDSHNPYRDIIERLKVSMGQRDLLNISDKKVLWWKEKVYELPKSTAIAAEKQPLESIHKLLSDCKQNRPEVWRHLINDIHKAIQGRQIRNESGGGGG